MCSNGLCCRDCKVGYFADYAAFLHMTCAWLTGLIVLSAFHIAYASRQYELRGVTCREAANDCDIPEICTGDSSQVKTALIAVVCLFWKKKDEVYSLFQCPHNVHKLDGYTCDAGQVISFLSLLYLSVSFSPPLFLISLVFFLRAGVLMAAVRPEMDSAWLCGVTVRFGWCQASIFRSILCWKTGKILGGVPGSADRFCYEKLNSEGTEKGNCGPDPNGQGWVQCTKQWVKYIGRMSSDSKSSHLPHHLSHLWQRRSVWIAPVHQSDSQAELWRAAGEAHQSDHPAPEQIHGLQVIDSLVQR